ncbi:LacI family transcriptional regulator [Termitidicoccus mucosus]|uniref:LacI family DNA-binding transcriptional regulator n=1 Tax=Termitidicoccus mucosus TaxID=1184151 RepID=UPI002FEE653B
MAVKEATILEVARLAKVSASTVSNVLNGKHDKMRPDTLERVMAAVAELGYAPNQMARGLKTGFVPIIGLIVPSVENPFWGAFARCVEHAAMARNCQVMLCNGERDLAREQLYAESMLSRGIRGVILGSSPLSMKHLAGLAKRGLKVVAFDRANIKEGDFEVDSVRVDNSQGTALAIGHLIKLGHRRIGFVSGPVNSSNRLDRLNAYRETLRAHGIKPNDKWEWLEAEPESDSENALAGRIGVKALLARRHPPTAFFGINDMTALGVIEGARELGLRVPQDVSVAGFDDIFLCRMSNPHLTTVRQPLPALTEAAVSLLLGRMSGTNTDAPAHINLPAELIERDSCGPV